MQSALEVRGRSKASRFSRSDRPAAVPALRLDRLLGTGLVGFQSRFRRSLGRVGRADNLHGAAGSRLALDDLTLHRRGILSQVERRGRLPNGLAGFGCE